MAVDADPEEEDDDDDALGAAAALLLRDAVVPLLDAFALALVLVDGVATATVGCFALAAAALTVAFVVACGAGAAGLNKEDAAVGSSGGGGGLLLTLLFRRARFAFIAIFESAEGEIATAELRRGERVAILPTRSAARTDLAAAAAERRRRDLGRGGGGSDDMPKRL